MSYAPTSYCTVALEKKKKKKRNAKLRVHKRFIIIVGVQALNPCLDDTDSLGSLDTDF